MKLTIPTLLSAIGPADPIERADWLDSEGPLPKRFTAAFTARALVDLGVEVRDNGTVAWTEAQLAALTKAAYDNRTADGWQFTPAIAIAALQSVKDAADATEAKRASDIQAAYDAFKAAAGNVGVGLQAARDAVADAPNDVARNAAARGLATAQADAEDAYDAANRALNAVRVANGDGYPPDDVMAAKHAARDRLRGSKSVRAWEVARAKKRRAS